MRKNRFLIAVLILIIFLQVEAGVAEIEKKLTDKSMSDKQKVSYILEIGKDKTISLSDKLRYSQKAEELAKKNDLVDELVRIYLWQSTIYNKQRDNKKAWELVNRAQEKALKSGKGNLRGNVYFHRGLLYISQYEYTKAKVELERAMEYEDELEAKTCCRLYNNLGNIQYYQNDYAEALSTFLKQRDLADKEGDILEKAFALSGIGNIYNALEDMETTRKNYEEAVELFKELGKEEYVYSIENNLGTVYSKLGDDTAAEQIYESVWEKALKYDDKETIFYIQLNLGILEFLHRDNFETALEYFKKAENYKQYINDEREKALLDLNFGSLYYKMGNYDEALKYLERSCEAAYKIPAFSIINDAIEVLMKVSIARNNYEKIGELLPEYFVNRQKLGADAAMKVTSIHQKYNQDKFDHQYQIMKQNEEIDKLRLERQRRFNYFVVIVLLLSVIILLYVLITNHKLKEMKNNLEIKVEENIKKLRQQDSLLIMQNHQAAMGEMISMIAHQWKQPLNAISIIAQGLEDSYDYGELTDEEMEKSVKEIMGLADFMSDTINSFRNYYMSEDESVFSLRQVIEHSLKYSEALLRKYNIEVNVEAAEGLQIKGKKNLLVQVFLSLIVNSRDAFEENETGTRNLWLKAEEREERKIQIEFRDNAGGIKEELLEKIFDPYFTTKSGEKGTGIGLYICRSVIEGRFGGEIKAENYASGCRFLIILPGVIED